MLAGTAGLILPVEAPYAHHIYHIYAVRVKHRAAVMQHLGDRGIGCGIHYPVPVHLQKAYADLGHKPGDFPVSEACAESFVSLPMFPELTDGQIETVVSELKSCLAAGAGA